MKFYISILIISLIICSPPPKPEPTYEIFVQTQKPVNYINDSSLKDLEENSASQIVEEMNVVVNILENGKYEEHELKIGTKNLPDEEFYREYKFYLILLEGQEFEIISNSCYKTLLSGANSTENNKCTFSLVEQINKIAQTYHAYKDVDSFARVVSFREISDNGYDLSIKKYVFIPKKDEEHENKIKNTLILIFIKAIL